MTDDRYIGNRIFRLTENSGCPGIAYKKGRTVILTDNYEAVGILERNGYPDLVSQGCWMNPIKEILEDTGRKVKSYQIVTPFDLENRMKAQTA